MGIQLNLGNNTIHIESKMIVIQAVPNNLQKIQPRDGLNSSSSIFDPKNQKRQSIIGAHNTTVSLTTCPQLKKGKAS